MKKPSHPSRGVPTAVNCLSTLLKEPMVRSSFVKADGVKLLIPLISPASTQQSIQVILHNLIPNKLHNWFEYKLVHVGPSNRWLGKLFFYRFIPVTYTGFQITYRGSANIWLNTHDGFSSSWMALLSLLNSGRVDDCESEIFWLSEWKINRLFKYWNWQG